MRVGRCGFAFVDGQSFIKLGYDGDGIGSFNSSIMDIIGVGCFDGICFRNRAAENNTLRIKIWVFVFNFLELFEAG